MLNKDQILGAQDISFEDVEAWGGTVRIKTMTGTERDAWEDSLVDDNGKPRKEVKKTFRANLLVRCICDEKLHLIFDEKDVPDLAKKSAKEIGKLYDVARKLNGIGKDAEEEIEKNSEAGRDEGSISA